MIDRVFADHFAHILDPVEKSDEKNLHRRFGHLHDDLWRTLLFKQFRNYPRIFAALPDWPEERLQREWTGNHGFDLGLQSHGFVRNVKSAYARYGLKSLAESRVLDFGIGWGRLIRYLAKDVEPEALCGCDPDPDILEVCRSLRIPGVIRQSEYLLESLPFEQPFDLVYAFSVFTHLGEIAHRKALDAIHRQLNPGGIFVATIRPRDYLPHMGFKEADYEKGYVFGDLQDLDPPPTKVYADAVVSHRYVLEHWTDRFELLDQWWLQEDMYQVAYVFRKR